MSRANEISDAAAAWLVRIEGHTSTGIWDELQAWLDRDPRHRAAFIRVRLAWNRVDRLKSLRPMDGTIDSDLLARTKIQPEALSSGDRQPLDTCGARPDPLAMPGRRRAVVTAAAVAAAAVFAWLALQNGSHPGTWKTYGTDIGGREKIELTDGSTVDLNTNTELNVRISGSRRDILLARGEALFHVAHDPARPFYVTAGATLVRAVGTAFSMRIRDGGHVEVIVAEGRVAISAPGMQANLENPSSLARAPHVSAGEAAVAGQSSVSVTAVPPTQLNRKLAWTAGHLAFYGETLADAIGEFNRYNHHQITIADPVIAKVRVGGNFLATDPESFAAALQRSFGFRVEAGDNKGEIRLYAGREPP